MRLHPCLLKFLAIALASALTACGGGGSDSASNPAATGNAAGTVTPPVIVTPPVVAPPVELPPNIVVPESPLDLALRSGDASLLKPADTAAIAIATRDFLAVLSDQQNKLNTALLGNASSEYAPTRQSQYLLPLNTELASPWIIGDNGQTLASISIANKGRSAGYGVNVLDQFRNNNNLNHSPAFKRLLSWLVQGNADTALPASLSVAWAGINASDGMAGLSKIGVTATKLACDLLADASCSGTAQLLILGGNLDANATLEATVRAWVSAGKPVLYLHTRASGDSESGRQMLSGMGLKLGGYAGNYFSQDLVAGGHGKADNLAKLDQFADSRALINRIANNNWRTDYAWSACTTYVGSINCDNVPDLQKDLMTPIESLRQQIDDFTRSGRNLFATPNTTTLRLLALWADVQRKQIVYPVDKTSKPLEFQKALVADALVAYVRPLGVAQTDLSSFLSKSAATLPVSANDETISVSLPADQGFTAIGRFAVPGKTLQIELIDAGSATVALRLNTQRVSSTRYLGATTYTRPRYLASPAISLTKASPLQVSSPYGGTMQLEFSGATAGQIVTLRIRGVAQHPYFDLSAGSDKAAFIAALNNGQFDWAEIKMPGAEIHTKVAKMKDVLQKDYGNDMVRYLDELRDLLIEGDYRMAGYALKGLDLPAAVQTFCTGLAWNCTDAVMHRGPSTQHINSDDFAACGDGCSGNPYDQDWGVNPRGWGESHELGHNQQQGILNIYGGRSGEVSNNLFPLRMNWRVLHEKNTYVANNVGYRSAFDMINAARSKADPLEARYQSIWGSDAYAAQNGERLAFYMQWVHYWHARVNDEARGWDIVTLLYLHQRQFARADWAANKDKLGYSQYATRPAVDGNDNMLIALSWITQRDQRPTFDLWGVRYSTTAAAQVASYAFAVEPALFYAYKVTPDKVSAVKKIDMSVATPVWPF
ncbi:ImpA family metalloprotease [Undibacterium sp.]|uniref:ImpA family metalloprotease n=1 Tax=Undibacterium sp. TaxID=1914977 RepID=UPI0025EF07F7|nr:ImpA family metalloprotease [Undibacterium sp.]